jgi:hypothetical protein
MKHRVDKNYYAHQAPYTAKTKISTNKQLAIRLALLGLLLCGVGLIALVDWRLLIGLSLISVVRSLWYLVKEKGY